jgi:hypothetical protein
MLVAVRTDEDQSVGSFFGDARRGRATFPPWAATVNASTLSKRKGGQRSALVPVTLAAMCDLSVSEHAVQQQAVLCGQASLWHVSYTDTSDNWLYCSCVFASSLPSYGLHPLASHPSHRAGQKANVCRWSVAVRKGFYRSLHMA